MPTGKALVFGAVFALPPSATFAAAPLQYLTGSGGKAEAVLGLTWFVLLVSIAVILVIGTLLAGAIWRRPGLVAQPGDKPPLEEGVSGHNWLWIGVGVSAFILLVSVVWTVLVLAKVAAPGTQPTVTIEVTGRQWWWQVRYIGDGASQGFTTANEIHIPVGQPIRLRLLGGDVIHSFWVPQLAGKMDATPGQINETWIEASTPGTYDGQCTEYCGLQHAKMLLRVVAQTPQDFHAWWAHQLMPPAATSPVFVQNCGGCHAVRGTDAKGTEGPDLSHLMQRATLASAVLPNDAPTLSHWISDPQSLKPGNRMPAVSLSSADHDSILTYLEGLH